MIDCEKDIIDWFNNLQIMKSYRQVYSFENDFSHIEKVEEIRRKQLIALGYPSEEMLDPTKKRS